MKLKPDFKELPRQANANSKLGVLKCKGGGGREGYNTVTGKERARKGVIGGENVGLYSIGAVAVHLALTSCDSEAGKFSGIRRIAECPIEVANGQVFLQVESPRIRRLHLERL